MLDFFLWYLTVTLAGWLLFPLVYRFFPNLPDRGFAFNRIFAWLIWGYLYWLAVTFGFLRNTATGVGFILLLLVGLSLWTIHKGKLDELKNWLKSQLRLVITIEALFMLTFGAMSFIRATNPEALGTEKPMELAFINAILRSPTFPPNDPWLSGFAISYYYFGYLLVAILAKLTHTSGGVAFNLGTALIFALSAIAVYGLIFNLLQYKKAKINQLKNIFAAFLGPIFLLIISNLEGFLHVLHTRGLFWKQTLSGEWISNFWRWLDIKDLNVPPSLPFRWIPDKFWWWWRASRVIQDYDVSGAPREIINEFPFFSFLLSDLHPHVLALPFALLAIALAMNQFWKSETVSLLKTELFLNKINLSRYIRISLSIKELILAGVILGSLAFLNTWDFPIYLVLFSCCYAFQKNFWVDFDNRQGTFLNWAKDFILICALLGITGVIFYLPFFLGFSSQAGGLVVNLVYPTRGAHFWIMFGVLLLPIIFFTLHLIKKQLATMIKSKWYQPFFYGLLLATGIMTMLWLASLLIAAVLMFNANLRSFYLGSLSAYNVTQLFSVAIERRITNAGGWITMLLLLALAFAFLFSCFRQKASFHPKSAKTSVFIIILVLTGCILVIFPEFFFLRDQFGWRMNTIFKFYFQAWILWSVVAAFGSIILLRSIKGWKGWSLRIVLSIVIALSLIYPLFSLPQKSNQFKLSDRGLDGAITQEPGEAAALQWLSQAPYGVIAEAVSPTGGSYSGYARFATLSGLPNVLGWMGHESQWRGGGEAMGTRQADMYTLYCSRDIGNIQTVLDRYNIRYVIIGSLERSTYVRENEFCKAGLNETILVRMLPVVFTEGYIKILAVPEN